MRSYFSTNYLWAAEHNVGIATAIEDAHRGEPTFNIEHRAHVQTGIVSAVAFLEAAINEVFCDAHDAFPSDVVRFLSPEARRVMSAVWRETSEGRKLGTLAKYQLLLETSGRPPMQRGAAPFQDADLVIQVRNALAHYQPENLAGDEGDVGTTGESLRRKLRRKFSPCALLKGAGNSWWPDHALGADCARWACRSVTAVTAHVATELGVRFHYQVVKADPRGLWATTPP